MYTNRRKLNTWLLPGGRGVIRAYRPEDREAVRQICCETGFLGEPIDPIFQDHDLFADLITEPYLTIEPEWALVAESDNRVIGYLLGSVSPFFHWYQLRIGFHITRKMLARLVTGHYAEHPRSRQFIRWLLTAAGRERPRRPGEAAHLHFNLKDPHRGRFLGRYLWQAFEQKLLAAGIGHCYGEFFSYPGRRPEHVYARYGFSIFDRRETTVFQPEMAAGTRDRLRAPAADGRGFCRGAAGADGRPLTRRSHAFLDRSALGGCQRLAARPRLPAIPRLSGDRPRRRRWK